MRSATSAGFYSLVAAAVITLPLLSATALVPPEQGGSGTIDPNSVSTHEDARFSIGTDPSETLNAARVAVDAEGNRYVGSVSRRPFTSGGGGPQTNPPRSVISKFAPSGALIWQGERKVTSAVSGTSPNQVTTYSETFFADQKPVVIGSLDGNSSVAISGLTIDSKGNVVAAFDEYQTEPYTIGTQTYQVTALSQRTLVVKFDNNGQFVWRQLTPSADTYDSTYGRRTLLKSLDTLPVDGSVIALLENFNDNSQNNQGSHDSVVLKFDTNGVRIFTGGFGLKPDGSVDFYSSPLSLTSDANANLYLVSSESPDLNTNPQPDTFVNVVRRLDAGGNVAKRVNVPIFPGYSATNPSAAATDTWVAGRVDAAGNLYVAGSHLKNRPSFSSPDQGESNQLVLKFAPDLTQVWRVLGPMPARTYSDQPSVGVVDIALSAGGLTVAGSTASNGVR